MRQVNQIYAFHPFELDAQHRDLRREGLRVPIHATPLRVLLYLVEHRDRTVSKGELLDRVWPDSSVGENALTSAICELRNALEDDGRGQQRIRTERGRGYAFIADIKESRAPRASEPLTSVAVLPFVDMSFEGDQASLVDGLTEEVIHELSQVEHLQVVSRTSVFALREERADVREIGCELDAGIIIEGSVRTAGPRARVTAQVIHTADGYHLWSGTFDRLLEDALDFEEEIALEVRSALEIHVPRPPRFVDPISRRVPTHDGNAK